MAFHIFLFPGRGIFYFRISLAVIPLFPKLDRQSLTPVFDYRLIYSQLEVYLTLIPT